jgi:glyoxylase-like metal-dependent hydrolase (beta-lactamase superfamily II)
MIAWQKEPARWGLARWTGPVGTGTVPLGHEVFQIDTRMAGYDGITAGYLIRGDRPCLVETGTAPSAPVVRDALAGLGIGPGDLATVVVTHIHLDHAGGAGDIAAMFPAARIVVHQRGARHLADPPGSWPAPGWSTGTRSTGSSGCSRRSRLTASWRSTTRGPWTWAAAAAWTATTPPATPSIT